MNVNRVIEVHDGSPVNTLRTFLNHWWEHYRPDALLAPIELAEGKGVDVKVIEDPGELAGVNPFAPIMTRNSAILANRIVKEHPRTRLGVILRPCELRSYVELRKQEPSLAGRNTLAIIGVDCLGTFSQVEYKRTVEARGLVETTREVLCNAAEGGLRPQRFRTACQICDWSAPRGADITIGIIGVPSDQYLLVISRDEATDQVMGLDQVVKTRANEYQVSHRETVVGAIADARAGMRRNMIEEMKGSSRFDDLGCILAWFTGCSLCGECLNACPLYDGNIEGLMSRRDTVHVASTPLGDVVSLGRWLASCSGCGMCEEECPKDVPLFLLISALSHRIRDTMRYRSGDPAQEFPWISA
jgi:formate dehydrogenase subunit beta